MFCIFFRLFVEKYFRFDVFFSFFFLFLLFFFLFFVCFWGGGYSPFAFVFSSFLLRSTLFLIFILFYILFIFMNSVSKPHLLNRITSVYLVRVTIGKTTLNIQNVDFLLDSFIIQLFTYASTLLFFFFLFSLFPLILSFDFFQIPKFHISFFLTFFL